MNQYIGAEAVRLVLSGNDYFDQLSEIISSAKEVLHIQTYIFEDDPTGNDIKEKLKAASKRGVKIFFLADAFGSKGLSKEFIQEIRSAGIKFRFFSPLFSSEGIYLGRRLHHKIVVADENAALIGGINIADKYHGTEENPAWLDFAVLLKGNCCQTLHNLCEGLYHRKKIIHGTIIPTSEKTSPLIRFRRNDWVRGRNEIHKSYREAILKADKSITILASYFLPGITFRKLLRKTVLRGVKLKIIVTGPSDVPFVRLAEKYLYRYLLNIGAEIYEWKDSVMHGKAMITDENWVTIGSYNINYLSHYRSIELNADVISENFSREVSVCLHDIINNHCVQITHEEIEKSHGLFQKLKSKFAYYFLQFILSIVIPKKRINIQ